MTQGLAVWGDVRSIEHILGGDENLVEPELPARAWLSA
jgi:hypothetical protein